MSESEEQITPDDIQSEEPPIELIERIEDLEEQVFDLQDKVESIQRRNDEQQFHEQSNFGY